MLADTSLTIACLDLQRQYYPDCHRRGAGPLVFAFAVVGVICDLTRWFNDDPACDRSTIDSDRFRSEGIASNNSSRIAGRGACTRRRSPKCFSTVICYAYEKQGVAPNWTNSSLCSFSCWCSAGNEGMTHINHALLYGFPLGESQGFIPSFPTEHQQVCRREPKV